MWTGSVFGLVRNPIYLGEVLFALGAALFWGAWVGLALVPFWYLFCFAVPIGINEAYLLRTLGRPYLQYKRRVPGRFAPRSAVDETGTAGRAALPQPGL